MSKNTKNFNKYLKNLLTVSGVSREELASRLKVAVPVVNRWLNGASVPDVYQFRDIARYFGMPYEWFLDGEVRVPTAAELAEKLGLAEATVRALMFVAESEDKAVMGAVDQVIWAVFSALITMNGNLEHCEGD